MHRLTDAIHTADRMYRHRGIKMYDTCIHLQWLTFLEGIKIFMGPVFSIHGVDW